MNVKIFTMEKYTGKLYGFLTKYINILHTFSEHMCAASPGKDACQGDSGGPMFLFENSR